MKFEIDEIIDRLRKDLYTQTRRIHRMILNPCFSEDETDIYLDELRGGYPDLIEPEPLEAIARLTVYLNKWEHRMNKEITKSLGAETR